jgi:LysR substrate binding domain
VAHELGEQELLIVLPPHADVAAGAAGTAAREAVVPLEFAGAGAALLPTALAREAQRRGAVVRAARPTITRKIGLIHRDGPLSAAARAFLAIATAGTGGHR